MVKKRVIALGFFDGIHIGHATLLNMANKRAKELGCTPAVLTFDTHPSKLLNRHTVPLLNSAVGRVDIIERQFSISDVLIPHFDDEMRSVGWEEFTDVLISNFNAAHVIVGKDFRFGYKGLGTPEKLCDKCAKESVGCDIMPEVWKNGRKVSSTYIRELISKGDMETANEYLGHPHTMVDTVRYGYKLGRTIGAPTINMVFPAGVLVPAFGVYATKVFIGKSEHMAVTNIGVRPTVASGEEVTVESYILDYNGDLYGRQVRVDFHKYMRPEMKFSGTPELKTQIQRDAEATREYFAQDKFSACKAKG